MFAKWVIPPVDLSAQKDLRQSLQLYPAAARVLIHRGYRNPEQVRDFTEKETPLSDFQTLSGIDAAVERVQRALAYEERIGIFGDFDVDGLTATALCWLYLQSIGADVVCSLPSRDTTGYGMSRNTIDNFASFGVKLIITVDNGISAFEEVANAASRGIDVIVTDHHLPPDRIPDAVAVIDPMLAVNDGCYAHLAGVGVALKFCAALEGCACSELLDVYGYLAALGTISDLMPLVGENRTIVKHGLEQLRSGVCPGINMLCELASIDLLTLDSTQVAFGIAPRLNAAGRMGTPDLALQLLLCEDEEEAQAAASGLMAANDKRREVETEQIAQLEKNLMAQPQLLQQPLLVLCAEYLHAGVMGITASRFAKSYGKPALVISLDGSKARGSARSIENFSIYDALAAEQEKLIKFGGHDMAAGFTLDAQNVADFAASLNRNARDLWDAAALPEILVDALLEPDEITPDAVAQLQILAPFGYGNEEPVFACTDLVLEDISPLGDAHCRLSLRKREGLLGGALFGITPAALPYRIGDRVDVLFSLSLFKAGKRETASVRFREIRLTETDDGIFSSFMIYNRYSAGQPCTGAQLAEIAPTRIDVAAVYRAMKETPVNRYDGNDVRARLRFLPPGKALAALDILEELRLTCPVAGDKQGIRVGAVADPQKNDLENSRIFRELYEAANHDIDRPEKVNRAQRQTV